MGYKNNLNKVIYNLQYIRDLYDKMFPSAKDYIKFLKERINTLDNTITSFMKILQNKKKYSPKILLFRKN